MKIYIKKTFDNFIINEDILIGLWADSIPGCMTVWGSTSHFNELTLKKFGVVL
jgi:hypothetical protein